MFTSKFPNIGLTIFTEISAMATKYQAINLAQGFPDFALDEKLQEAFQKALARPVHQYAPMAGSEFLRNEIANNFFKRYNIKIPISEMTICPGATYGIYTALATIISPGDEVIILEPAYDSYKPNIESLQGKVKSVALNDNDFSVNWDLLNKTISTKTKAIILNTPHNPTGTLWQKSDYENLWQCIKDKNIFVIADEVYDHLTFDGEIHHSILQFSDLYQRSFIIYSFGKVLQTTGIKIGYVVAPEYLSNEFKKLHQYIGFAVNHLSQEAIAIFLSENSFIDKLQLMFQEKRDYFLNAYKHLPFTVPFISKGSYFQLLSFEGLSDKQDKDFAIQLCQEAGVASIPLSPFYTRAYAGKLLRFCFAKNRETIDASVVRFEKYLKI